MLKRLLLTGLAVAALTLASPCYAIDPTADVIYHPVNQATGEATLTQQIQATMGTVEGAYNNAGQTPPPQATSFADSHTVVFSDVAAGLDDFFTLPQYDSTRVVNGNPVGKLEGVLLYLTVKLKNGRQVLDNESNQIINGATVDIGVGLTTLCTDPTIDLKFTTNPRVTKTVSTLGADPDGTSDYPNYPYYPDISTMTQAEIDSASTGVDRLAAIIDPTDPNNSYSEAPVYTSITDPTKLAAFEGDGEITFAYLSSPTSSHFAGSQDVIEWSVPPTFDIEARVVYLYAGVPEPATIGLMSVAFLPMLRRRLRKKKRQ